ncbi:MAG: DUF2785 domain-containing protein [Erysipelothrix sp.]|nr:DUF2785 domain-containing protein [Erysipelothrix sp.]
MNNQTIIEQIESAVNNKQVNQETLRLMLENIGNIDGYLRDDIIFESLYYILDEDIISSEDKIFILDYILENNLPYFDIEKIASDGVYTRAFTALLLVEILKNHYQANWIDKTVESELIKMCMEYLFVEQDQSGKDPVKGWSHAFAHGADLIGACTMSDFFTDNEVKVF